MTPRADVVLTLSLSGPRVAAVLDEELLAPFADEAGVPAAELARVTAALRGALERLLDGGEATLRVTARAGVLQAVVSAGNARPPGPGDASPDSAGEREREHVAEALVAARAALAGGDAGARLRNRSGRRLVVVRWAGGRA